MKYLDEYRDGRVARGLLDEIRRTVTRPWVIMEVCGGQTHSIVKHGIDRLIPPEVELVHGPGCPVCVTSLEMIDKAHAIASRPDVIFCSFGDMLRVPGSRGDLLTLKGRGADIRVVYAPLDCLQIARAHADKKVVFFGIGFETTAPANALAVRRAQVEGVANFSMLVSHVLVPPAITAILQSPQNRVQAYLGPGHVCTVMGYSEYEPIAARYRVPIVVTGFEPVDLLHGILMAVRQLEAGRHEVENQYSRLLTRDGNRPARDLIFEVFEVVDRKWRGVGAIPKSGYRLRWEYRHHDAERLFEVEDVQTSESPVCISGLVLRGVKKPPDCPAFGTDCTPQRPLGATMVSAEGACAAYFSYGRHLDHEKSILRKTRESAEVAQRLLEREAGRLEECVRAMAARFREGGRLFAMGNGGSACDAQHVAVEFQHPIIEKRRALPALALTADTAMLTAIGNDTDFALVFSEQLRLLGAPRDMALGISTSGQSANVTRGLSAAREMGMLTLAFSGRDGGRLAEVAEYAFVAPSFSIHRIQETHTVLLHLLWDQLHVALGEEDVL